MRFALPLLFLFVAVDPVHAQEYRVGVAKTDITPDYPIRLSGFGGRRTESEGVTQKLWAKALVVMAQEPTALVTVDSIGIPLHLRNTVAERLAKKIGLKPARLAICATHTHTAPMIGGNLTTLFGVPVPPEHQAKIDRYTAELTDKLEQVVLDAQKDAQPATLHYGLGSAHFANNRRTQGGPVDHDLPMLVVKSPDGKVRAIFVNYACHCTTLSFNRITGDWAGYAAEYIEEKHPGAVALVGIGCGADANPIRGVTRDRVDLAQGHGKEIAVEVERLLGGFLKPITGKLTAKWEAFPLQLDKLPSKEEWETRSKRPDAVGYHARVQLERLQRGEKLKTQIDYSVQTWVFGDSLAMVFLPGEVVVDYALRLKKELDPHRVWINAYTNDVPCYIPSERILKEGGYEGGGAMTYYDVPASLKAGLEQPIIDAVEKQLGTAFKAPFDANKLGGTKPLSPQQSMATFRTDYHVELMVAEPLVTSPVAIDWGPDGRMYVAEMVDYPQGIDGKFQPGGRIRLLTASKGDGKYDQATVFLDNIPFPTGVTAYRKGLLVCAAPDILYAEDTDGDGKADVVKKLYSGFGTENYQARVNSIRYGLDNWWYASCGLYGGKIHCTPLTPGGRGVGGEGREPLTPNPSPRSTGERGVTVPLGNRDFRIRPDQGLLEPATGRTQQGRCRDDWGSWFGCDNSTLGWHYPLPDHYLRRNPHVAAPPSAVPMVADATLFPAAKNLQLFNLSGPSGRPTAACGLEIYRDDLLGEAFTGNAFICEPVNLLIHRRILRPSGSTFKGVRAPEERDHEFLAATDPWFRPVQVRTGPDGALWVVDMHRYVIEHPIWIPPADLAKLDLRAGSTMGRIYRIYPKNKPPRPMVHLNANDTPSLVAALDSPNGWQRDMASQMLLWKGDVKAMPLLEKMTNNKRPEARLHALCVLEGMKLLPTESVVRSLQDPHPGVRRNAFRLLEAREARHAFSIGSSSERDAQVRLQAVLTWGQLKQEKTGMHLGVTAVAHREDPYLLAGVFSSLHQDNLRDFLGIVLQGKPGKTSPSLMDQSYRLAAGMANDATLRGLLSDLATPRREEFETTQMANLAPLLDALRQRRRPLEQLLDAPTTVRLRELLRYARRLALNETAPLEDRVSAVGVLGHVPAENSRDLDMLKTLLGPKTPLVLQAAALAGLGRSSSDDAAVLIASHWLKLSPANQSLALDLLLSRERWHWTLLDGLESKEIPSGMIDAARRQRLMQHPDAEFRKATQKVFAGTTSSRAQVLKEYQEVLSLRGDRTRGKTLFQKHCSNCHKLEDVGHSVGPDLAAIGNRTPTYLLGEILDPNRTIDSRYVEYAALTKAGLIHNGILASESSTSITLRGQEGKEHAILRTDLDELRSTGKSLMPEGLEKDIPKKDMADLLAYVAGSGPPPKRFAGNTPAPVRVKDGNYALLATNGEIYGEQICYEAPFQNIGYWYGLGDHVSWTVVVEKAGSYDVWLDWACAPDSAGNFLLVEGGQGTLSAQVASTSGWDRYQQKKLGTIMVEAGERRFVVRPAGPTVRGALLDLRGIHLVPADFPPPFAVRTAESDDPNTVAGQLMDDKISRDRKNALVEQHVDKAAEIIAAMTADMGGDAKEEYRRIPWIWRVAITAARKNQTESLRKLLLVSLPKERERLRDWQAVVIGGGIVNGISQNGQWPHQRLAELFHKDLPMLSRFLNAVKQAPAMADNLNVSTGTRYDALRMLALISWTQSRPQLTKYLAKGVHNELQMGAISALSDVDEPEVAELLLGGMDQYSTGNRKLALEALVRTEDRSKALLEAIEKGKVKKEWLDEGVKKKLGERKGMEK